MNHIDETVAHGSAEIRQVLERVVKEINKEILEAHPPVQALTVEVSADIVEHKTTGGVERLFLVDAGIALTVRY